VSVSESDADYGVLISNALFRLLARTTQRSGS